MQLFKIGKLQIIVMLFCILILLFMYVFAKNSPKPIDFYAYDSFVTTNDISSAKILGDEVIIYTSKGTYSIVKDAVNISELSKLTPIEVETVVQKESDWFLIFLMMVALFGALYYFRTKKTKVEFYQNETQNKNIAIEQDPLGSLNISPSTSKVKFSDVAGIEEVKEELTEIVDFLKNPNKYQKMNIKLPRGVLLVGPPGVGKTLVAKAVAGEANVPFFYQSGASFVQIYVGMGAKRVRELFSIAKRNAPSIIFIDEIDAVGKARGGMRNDEREATLNQLLTEMDGFEDNSGVIVIAATNKIEMIDDALLRSGRFDRRVFISLPDMQDRVKILETYLKDKNHNIDIKNIAKITVGFNGAALATLVNEAAINALRNGKKIIENDDFLAVRDKVLLGKMRVMQLGDKEKVVQATYQAAKALSAYWFEVEFDKISLIGDFTKELDKEIESKSELLSKVKVALSGIAILKIKYGESYSNSAEDLNKARRVASSMVEKYAMGEKLLPVAHDIEKLLSDSLAEIEKFLEGMQKPLEDITKILIEEESLTKAKIKEILSESF
ncbi:MAG: AAA family ATPase [Campylobacteraceae bacterium]